MVWVRPMGCSREKVNRAGDILISDRSSEEERNEAMEILDNWRASHSYPMHVFKIRLKNKAKLVDGNALTAQRLKRSTSIIKKLKRRYDGREPTMKLSQMQDIGGCRAVLSDVAAVRKLCEDYYSKGDLKHKRVGMKDYITSPKKDGYRSIHLIYRYFSDKGKKEYDGLLVEIQIRTKLQHLWATAVETVDLFTHQAIKTSEGQKEWSEFFRLLSSAFAKMENCPSVPDAPDDEKELYSLISKKEKGLNVIKKMSNWTNSIKIFEEAAKTRPGLQYFLLELDIARERLHIIGYMKRKWDNAVKDYAEAEKINQEQGGHDAVLIGVDAITDLKKAYPNYFADSKEFLSALKRIISKPQDGNSDGKGNVA